MLVDYETDRDIQAACEIACVLISSDQLRRWRLKGLLPHAKQVGLGRGAGSIVRYPIGTARQALEIHRLLGVKEKLDFVGWQLWMQGYGVAEEYWRSAIRSAWANLKHIPAWLRMQEIRNPSERESIFDRVSIATFANTPFAKGLAKLPPDGRALSFGLMADVAGGSFQTSQTLDEVEQNRSRQAISTLVGQSQNPIVGGLFKSKIFQILLEEQLEGIARAFAEFHRRPYAALLQLTPEVRRELTIILQLASELNSVPGFSKGPIAKFAKVISSDQAVQAHMVIIWSLFRNAGTILAGDEIAKLGQFITAKFSN